MKFLSDIVLENANDLQFRTAGGVNAGKIAQDGNNLVLSNAVGDILLGDGASDIYIGDGTNNVDILFEQSGSIKAENGSSGVTLTLGSSDTTLALVSPSFSGTVTSSTPIASAYLDSDTAHLSEAQTFTGQKFFDAGFDAHPIMLSGAQNFDNLDRSGFYNMYNTNSGSTSSPGHPYGTMISIGNDKGSSGFGFQMFHQRTGGANALKVRGMNDDNSWSSWETVYTSGDTIPSADLDSDTAHLSTTQTFSGAKTFSANTSLVGFILDGNTITGVDDSGEFTDDDAHIMTSAGVLDKIQSEIANLVDSSPGALNTLNELAAALGDDASFSTTVTNSIATKLPLAGGTMSGAIAMGSQNITGAGTITGTTLTGTSLDINGAADITGITTLGDQIHFTAGGSLIKKSNTGWSNATTHDVIYQGWLSNVGDYIYLKAPGNSTADHAIALIGDDVIAFGRSDTEEGHTDNNSATAPLSENWFVLNGSQATFAGDIAVSGTVDGIDIATRDAILTSTTTTAGTALQKAGGTMSGAIAMGNQNITGVNEITFDDGFKFFGGGNNNYLKAKSASTTNGGIIFQDGDAETMGYLYWDGASTASFGFLDGTGSWAVRCRENEYVELLYDNAAKLHTKTDGVDITGELQADSLDIDGNADISGTLDVGIINSDGIVTINPGTNAVSTLKLRRNTTGDNTIVGDIEFDTTAAQGTDDRIALIRAQTSAGDGSNRGGQMNLYTRQSGSANFNTTTYSKDGNWVFPGEVEASSLDINGNADISGTLTLGGDVTIINSIIHAGDTNTYFGFHNADEWRVVTGGTERFEVTNTATTINTPLSVNGAITIPEYIVHNGDSNTLIGFPAGDRIILHAGGNSNVELVSNGVTLRYSGATKLETVSGGIEVTGEVQGDTLNIDGAADISGALTGVDAITMNGALSGATTIGASGNVTAGHIIIGDDGNIGSASDPDAIAIDDSGLVLFSGDGIEVQGNMLCNGGALSITGDGSNAVTLTESGTGVFTIDATGNIILDSDTGQVVLADGGSNKGLIKLNGNDLELKSEISNGDIKFNGNDGGSAITALTLDMSAGGKGIFAGSISCTTLVPSSHIYLGATKHLYLDGGGNTSIRESSADTIQLTCGGSVRQTITTSKTTFAGELEATTLDINGAADISGSITTTVASGGADFLNVNFTGNEAFSFGARSGEGVDDYIDVGISGGTRVMSWHEDGKVGIGTVAPASKLHVAGTVQVGVDDTGHDVFFYGATSGAYLQWDESGDALELKDSTYLYLGTGNDLQLYHDGSNSYIKDAGPGELKLYASALAIQSASGNEYLAYFAGTGAQEVSLYAGNAVKFKTVSAGIEVTGEVQADTLDIDGAADIAGALVVSAGAVSITGDGSNAVTLTESGSGDFTVDAPGDIILDADTNDVIIKDAGASRLTFNFTNSGHFYNVLSVADKIWGVKGIDGSTAITALSIDMAAAGKATFNNDVVAFSDRKLKENIQTLDGKKVLEMRGVSFTRKDTKEQSSGVIAQEMQEVAPELVSESQGTLGVSYGNLVGYLIEAVKDQQKQIDELKAMINGSSK